uniref:Transposase (Putative), gypsy type n=1 Tax=Tanacetum cinerariifolium TaxID=118510 RepID=A0A6L2JSZ4_TANCI|nr:hypothetical protein [Tanacetum cinerariifolium]
MRTGLAIRLRCENFSSFSTALLPSSVTVGFPVTFPYLVSMKYVLTQSALDALSEKFHIPDTVHPELPGPNDRIRNIPTEMDLLAVIHHADPTKVRIGEKKNKDVQDAGVHVVNEGDDHDNSGYVGVGTGRKSLAVIQELFEQSTLNVEVGVMAAATVPFITSFMTPTLEREDGGHSDNVFVANLGTQCQSKRFVISSDSSHDSSANDEDDEITSIVRDSSSPSTIEVDVVGPSQLAGVKTSTDTFLVSQDFDSALDDPEVYRNIVDQLAPPSAEVRLRFEHNYMERKKFEKGCAWLTGLLREKDVEDLSNFQISCDELSIIAASLNSEKDKLADQVFALKGTCSELRDEVSGYKLFKEQIEAMQDKQVKMLSDKVKGIDVDLLGMALHLDEEFYPHFLTTIAGGR